MRFFRESVAIGLISCLTAGCGTSGPSISSGVAAVAARTGHSQSDLATGLRIYTTKCVACHSAEPISRYSEKEWRGILPKMSGRAKLSETEREQLAVFVMASRAGGG